MTTDVFNESLWQQHTAVRHEGDCQAAAAHGQVRNSGGPRIRRTCVITRESGNQSEADYPRRVGIKRRSAVKKEKKIG